MRLPTLFLLLLSPTLGAQTIVEYTAFTGPLALGYPPPMPVESLTPVAGFRSLDSLQARHQSLYLESPWVSGGPLASSREGRSIWAYQISDANALTAEGFPEPAALFSATLHAREWQSPEVVTGLFESLVDSASDGGLGQFLVENLQVVLVPLVNPDGFAHTQRYPTRTVSISFDYRDGRQRRKNHRSSDGELETLDDYLQGVDLNRQFPPFWGQGGSGSPSSLQYRGPAALSEPEASALASALDSDTAARLRLYADFHSFGRVFIVPQTDRPTLDSFSRDLVGRLQAHLGALSSPYSASYPSRSAGIGATDEYFAETFGVPSWTFEIEPGSQGASEYGGFGVRGDGFILPASEIARVREEIDSTYRLALYHQYGPPVLLAVEIHDQSSGEIRYAARWEGIDDNTRRLVISDNQPLAMNRGYRLWLAFDKPMRHRVSDLVVDYPGQSVNLGAEIALTHAGGEWLLPNNVNWLEQAGASPDGYHRYRDDTLVVDFTTPEADWVTASPGLRVAITDMAGQALDSQPDSAVGFQAGWTGYQPGADQVHRINAGLRLQNDGFEP